MLHIIIEVSHDDDFVMLFQEGLEEGFQVGDELLPWLGVVVGISGLFGQDAGLLGMSSIGASGGCFNCLVYLDDGQVMGVRALKGESRPSAKDGVCDAVRGDSAGPSALCDKGHSTRLKRGAVGASGGVGEDCGDPATGVVGDVLVELVSHVRCVPIYLGFGVAMDVQLFFIGKLA